jgi:hypothetical protein
MTIVSLGQWAAMSRTRGPVRSLLTGPEQVSSVVGWAIEADFWPMMRMENVNLLYFSEISLKVIQTSKFHIKFNYCPEIMKSILLFF